MAPKAELLDTGCLVNAALISFFASEFRFDLSSVHVVSCECGMAKASAWAPSLPIFLLSSDVSYRIDAS